MKQKMKLKKPKRGELPTKEPEDLLSEDEEAVEEPAAEEKSLKELASEKSLKDPASKEETTAAAAKSENENEEQKSTLENSVSKAKGAEPEQANEKPDEQAADTVEKAKEQAQKPTPEPTVEAVEATIVEEEPSKPVDPMTLGLEDLQQYVKGMLEERDKIVEQLKRGQMYFNQLGLLKRDFDNFRRRNQSVAESAKDDGKVAVIEKLLTVLDTFDRAMESLKGKGELNAFLMVYRQFEKVLTDIGVEAIDTLGKEFDPNTANAVLKEEVDDESKKNIVLEVYAKGYRYKERVIRYAQVKVGV